MSKGNKASYNYEHFTIKPYLKWYKSFQDHLKLGERAPPFTLSDTEGRKALLSDCLGKFVVLVFGCMTCAPAVGQIASYENSISEIAPKYSKDGVEFLMIYTRETHPGEKIRPHKSIEEKIDHAKRFKKEEKVGIRILVDTVGGKVHGKYGWLPNMAFIIDRKGKIVFKASWTDTKVVEDSLRNLLLWEKEGFTPSDSIAVVEKYHFVYDRDIELRKRVYALAGKESIKDLRKEINLKI